MYIKTPFQVLEEAASLLKLLNEILVGDCELKSPPIQESNEQRSLEQIVSTPGFPTSGELMSVYTVWRLGLNETLAYYAKQLEPALLELERINNAPLAPPILDFPAEDYWRTSAGQALAKQLLNDVNGKAEVLTAALHISADMDQSLMLWYSQPIDQIVEFRRSEAALYYLGVLLHNLRQGSVLEVLMALPERGYEILKDQSDFKKRITDFKKILKAKLRRVRAHDKLLRDPLFSWKGSVITISDVFTEPPIK